MVRRGLLFLAGLYKYTERAIALALAVALVVVASALAKVRFFLCDGHGADRQATLYANRSCCTSVCVCIPILVTTFPKWLSDTEPLPHTPGAVCPSICFFICLCYSFALLYLFGYYKDRVFPSRMTTNNLISPMNFAIIRVLPFLNNPKDLDLSYKTDLDVWNCFGGK